MWNDRQYHKDDLTMLIDDLIRLDIPDWPADSKHKREFVKASYKKFAADDIEQFVLKRLGPCPVMEGQWIVDTILEYADYAKTWEFYAGPNSIIFKIMYDVAMDIVDVVSHSD